jgi:hypothetical protein
MSLNWIIIILSLSFLKQILYNFFPVVRIKQHCFRCILLQAVVCVLYRIKFSLLSMLHLLWKEQLLGFNKVPNLKFKHLEAGWALLKALISRILCLNWASEDLVNVNDIINLASNLSYLYRILTLSQKHKYGNWNSVTLLPCI